MPSKETNVAIPKAQFFNKDRSCCVEDQDHPNLSEAVGDFLA